MINQPLISSKWNPLQFAGLRRWSLLIFVTLVLFFIASQVPLFNFSNNPAYEAWDQFHQLEGEAPQKQWKPGSVEGITFDQQTILEVRRTYDPADQPGAAPSWLFTLRRVASVTTHLAEGYAVLFVLLVLTLLTRFISGWNRFQVPIQGAFLGAVTAGVLAQGLKVLIGRGRPNELIYRAFPDWQPISFEHSHHSLPSGHSTAAGVMVMLLCVLFPRMSPLWICSGIWLCATRVLTAEHWPSDTLPGFILGAFCCAFWISRFQPTGDLSQSSTTSQRPLE